MKHKFTLIAVLLFFVGTVNVFSQKEEQKQDPWSMFNLSNVKEEVEKPERPSGLRELTDVLVLATSEYVPGETVNVLFSLSFGSPDAEWADGFEMTFPAGLLPVAAGSIGGMPFSQIVGQTVEWGDIPGGSGWGWITPGSYSFSVTIAADASVTGDQTVAWTIHGDGFGGPPHVVSGTVIVSEGTLQVLACPPGGIPESEPCGDDLNGGCNMDPGEETWEIVQPGDIICGTLWAEVIEGTGTRDTDWFEMVLTDFSHVVLHADAEGPMNVLHLSPTNCADIAVVAQMTAGPFTPNSLDLGVLSPGTYWFWTGLNTFDGYPCDVNYVIEFEVTPASPVYCDAGPTTIVDSNVERVFISGENDTEFEHIGCSPPVTGAEDLTHLSVDLTRGETYTLEVTFGTCGDSYSGAGSVWIDWGQDFLFDPADLIHGSTGTPGTAPWDGPVSISFTVPATAELGNTVMRVMQREFGSLPLDPCGTYSWGSVMDFGINVLEEIIEPFDLAITTISLPFGQALFTWDHPEISRKGSTRDFLGFDVFLDDMVTPVETGLSDGEHLFEGLNPGSYTAGVRSAYDGGTSDIITLDFVILDDDPIAVPVSNWALYLTILLIGVFIFVRFRKMM